MSSKIYLYRRKGNSEWATCDQSRFVELSSHKLFDTKICYEGPPELAELQATIAELTDLLARANTHAPQVSPLRGLINAVLMEQRLRTWP